MTEENKKPEPLDSARDDSQEVKSAESETLKEEVSAPEVEKLAETPKEETLKEAAPAPEAEKPAAAPQEEGTKKRKKINLMSLKEIDEKLKQVKEKMGNLKSNYASQLLKQQSILGGTKES